MLFLKKRKGKKIFSHHIAYTCAINQKQEYFLNIDIIVLLTIFTIRKNRTQMDFSHDTFFNLQISFLYPFTELCIFQTYPTEKN